MKSQPLIVLKPLPPSEARTQHEPLKHDPVHLVIWLGCVVLWFTCWGVFWWWWRGM